VPSSVVSLHLNGNRCNLKTKPPRTPGATAKTTRAVRQLPPARRTTRSPMAAYTTIIRPVAPTTGAEKKAYCREKARNTQTQLKPTPVMMPYAMRDQGARRGANFSVPSSSIVSGSGVITTKAIVPTTKTGKPQFSPCRSPELDAMKPPAARIKVIPRKVGQKKPAHCAFFTMTCPSTVSMCLASESSF
jgi:hypothetical protein